MNATLSCSEQCKDSLISAKWRHCACIESSVGRNLQVKCLGLLSASKNLAHWHGLHFKDQCICALPSEDIFRANWFLHLSSCFYGAANPTSARIAMLSPKSTHQGNNRGAFPFCLGPVLSRPCCFSDDSNRISSTSDISDSIFSHGSSIFAVSCGNLFTVVQT